jgi:HTH-type transcriptional regulator, sugar sensing transcriptional regulator
MDNATLIEMIRKSGFSDYEAKCYLALLERDSLAVNEIAKLAGVPRPSAYDVLEKLMDKGLVSAIAGKTKRYSASDPRILKEKALTELVAERESLERKQAEILEREKEIHDNMDTVISTLVNSFEQNRENGSALDYIKIYRNRNQIHNKFLELLSKTQREILVFNKPPFAYTTQKQREEQYRLQDEAAERGVKKRIIYQLPPEDQLEAFFATALEKYHEPVLDEGRVIDELPIKLFVFDDRYCFFTLEDPVRDKTSLTMVALEHEAMASSFKFLFESFWEKGRDHIVINNKKIYVDFKAKKNSEQTSEAEDK